MQLSEQRREQIRALLIEAGAVTVSELQARFGVSPMTARRDLDELERRGVARRTHGGAVLPSVAAPEHSFTQRVGVATEAKTRLADAAFELLRPGETVFLDSSSTAFFLARRIADAGDQGARDHQQRAGAAGARRGRGPATSSSTPIGGMLRRLTGSYVGPSSVRMIREHFADRLFLSVTGVTHGRRPDRRRRARGRGQARDARAGRRVRAAARRLQARGPRPPGDRVGERGLARARRRARRRRRRAPARRGRDGVRHAGEAALRIPRYVGAVPRSLTDRRVDNTYKMRIMPSMIRVLEIVESQVVRALEQARVIALAEFEDGEQAVTAGASLVAAGCGCVEIQSWQLAVLRAARRVDGLTVGAATCAARRMPRPPRAPACTSRPRRRPIPRSYTPAASSSCRSSRASRHRPRSSAWRCSACGSSRLPRDAAGGPAYLQALADSYPELRFIPSGGIGPEHVRGYLRTPSVIAVGVGGLVGKDLLRSQSYARIEWLAHEAVRGAGPRLRRVAAQP